MEKYIIENVDSFEPAHIFKCGQAFRWNEEKDSSFTNVAFNRVINVKKEKNNIILSNVNEDDFNNIWKDYFDLNRDYNKMKEILSEDEILKTCIDYGEGIRILNQSNFETIITFIISANNQIPRIKKSVELISEMYGDLIEEINGKKYYAFPNPEQLSRAKVEDLREFAKVGFRDKRIVESAIMINNNEIDFDICFNGDLEDARNELMKLPGVGPKVADCCLLFSFKRSESFPVDVWIKRVMEELYFHKETNKNQIANEGRKLFKEYAGIAQQYLFFYGRENKLGSK